MKPDKFGARVNLFGTWLRAATPVVDGAAPAAKKQATSAWSAIQCLMVTMGDVLVWPVVVESGSKEQRESEGVRIPFGAFDYLRDTYSINMAVPQFIFSERGWNILSMLCGFCISMGSRDLEPDANVKYKKH